MSLESMMISNESKYYLIVRDGYSPVILGRKIEGQQERDREREREGELTGERDFKFTRGGCLNYIRCIPHTVAFYPLTFGRRLG